MQLYRDYDGSPTGENLLPDFFFSQSSSMSVNNSFMTVQDNFGQVLTSPKGTLSARTFSITGNVDAERCTNVEELRASLFNKMYGKVLWLKLQENDKRIFKVILDGNVNVTYNIGYEISRVFTFSFTLKAFEGVSWGSEIITRKFFYKILVDEESFYCKINYKGDIPVIPYISISFVYKGEEQPNPDETDSQPFKIKSTSGNTCFIYNRDRQLNLSEDLLIEKFDYFFFIKNGLAYIGKSSVYKYLFKGVHPNSLARPLLLYPGINRMLIRTQEFELSPEVSDFLETDDGKKAKDKMNLLATIKYRPCYF